MDVHTFWLNLSQPPVPFFFLGVIAVLFKSDLEVPPAIGKFLSLYLLFAIGTHGGENLADSGFTPTVLYVILAGVVVSFFMPYLSFRVLRIKLDVYNAGAIAATYGSVSAVTFGTTQAFLRTSNVPQSGYLVVGMALMESPAIISGLMLIRLALAQQPRQSKAGALPQTEEEGAPIPAGGNGHQGNGMGAVLREAFFNGSVLLLLGSLVIGFLGGKKGEEALKPFISDIYKGMLCLYLLDMGILAGRRLGELKTAGSFLGLFAVGHALFGAVVGIALAAVIGLHAGDALLFTVLCASASYIAVPAAMRMAVPQANMSLLLPMSLGITFSFNLAVGIPLYYYVIQQLGFPQ